MKPPTNHPSWLDEANASLSTRSCLVIARDLLAWLNSSRCMMTGESRNEGTGIIREAVAALVEAYPFPYTDKDDDCGICGNTGRFCSVCRATEESCQCPDFSHGRDCPYCRGPKGAVHLPFCVSHLKYEDPMNPLFGQHRPCDCKVVSKCSGNHAGPRCADPECWNQ